MRSGLGPALELMRSLAAGDRPFRPRELARCGIEPRWLHHFRWLTGIVRLERGIYADGKVEFPRIAIALVRVNRSFACLESALWMHGLLPDEPAEAWVGIHHKAWKPNPMPMTPMRIVRTSLWPEHRDLFATRSGLPFTRLPRTLVDFFRYKRLATPTAPSDALTLALESGKCTLAEIEECAERLRVRWRPG